MHVTGKTSGNDRCVGDHVVARALPRKKSSATISTIEVHRERPDLGRRKAMKGARRDMAYWGETYHVCYP